MDKPEITKENTEQSLEKGSTPLPSKHASPPAKSLAVSKVVSHADSEKIEVNLEFRDKKRKRSTVHQWISIQERGDDKVYVCLACQFTGKYHGSTSALSKHIEKCPKIQRAKQVKEMASEQSKITSFVKPKKQKHLSTREEALVVAVVAHSLPMNLVELPHFKNFVQRLDPSFNLPGRKKFSTQINSFYERAVQAVRVPPPIFPSSSSPTELPNRLLRESAKLTRFP